MASDLTRLSYDQGRRYTRVVKLQGRVALDAVDNEQCLIDDEERRKELIDIVGPAGTPDSNAYALTQSAEQQKTYDFGIGPGTMYVGGMRVELDEPITLRHQPDWLDAPPDLAATSGHVLLTLQETDVTAVEDPALREVALGGPDSADRTLLLQHIDIIPTQDTSCAAALDDDQTFWAGQGLEFDPKTMRLNSASRLQVTWEGGQQKPNPCEPNNQGGYLGAENQLIRVQVAAVDTKGGTFDLLWGWDNASMLYRVTPDEADTALLTLQRSPVDDYHWPTANQPVQVLRSTATLADSDGTTEGYVAALHGEVAKLATAYDPDAKTVRLPGPLPADYTAKDTVGPLYLRVWQELLPAIKPGVPILLEQAGMTVTLSIANGFQPHVGDHWSIAVRPDTPSVVYPERYLRAPQPPDGPRLWACPLYVIGVTEAEVNILDDCRHPFGPLTGIDGGGGGTGCCTLEVRPSDAVGDHLQELIHAAAAARPETSRANRITVCFQPGIYALEHPIELDDRHSNVELRGCSEAVVLAAAPDHDANFPQGLIVAERANNVTITGFEFQLPQVPFQAAQIRSNAKNRAVIQAMNVIRRDMYASIAIRPVHCAELEVSHCLFRFSVGEHQSTREDEARMPRSVFGVAVFAASECWGLRLVANRFLHEPELDQTSSDAAFHVLVGYLLMPTIISATFHRMAPTMSTREAVLPALLRDVVVRDNIFDGISVAVFVAADVGIVDIHHNIVRRSYGGLWLLDPSALANIDLTGEYQAREAVIDIRPALSATLYDPYLALIRVLGSIYPLPPNSTLEDQLRSVTDKSATSGEKLQRKAMTEFLRDVASSQPAAEDAPKTNFNAAAESPGAGIDATPCAFQPVHRVNQRLLAIERDTLLSDGDRGAQLCITDNDIDCAGDNQKKDVSRGFAVLVFFGVSNTTTSLVLANNRLVTNTQVLPIMSAFCTALVIGVAASTVTGNVIRNYGFRGISLYMLVTESALTAVTGNVLDIRATLPSRSNQPAGFETWDPLNMVTV